MLIVRQENEKDYDEVYHVIKTAFKNAQESDGLEQDLVVKLRKSPSFIPELSLVACVDDKIVGYILFTKVYIKEHVALALAPLAVLPQYQRQGIGISLIKEGHTIARNLGYDYSIVLGHEQYYPQVGYIPASCFGIQAPFDVPDKNYMAIKFNENVENYKGIVRYDQAFGIE